MISRSGPFNLEKLSWANLGKLASGDQLEARRLASPIRLISAITKAKLTLHSECIVNAWIWDCPSLKVCEGSGLVLC